MRTLDTLIAGFITWCMFIIALIFIPELFPQFIVRSQEYVLFGVISSTGGFFSLILYYYLLIKEQKMIINDLLNLKNKGITILLKNYERLLYSRDVGDIPRVAKLLINFNCLAVVQPKDIIELKMIIDLCEKYQISLIARGAGTSGYGGVLSLKNGIVIDLIKWDKIITINEKSFKVEVECGVTWENLRNILKEKKLELKSYPSSAPSSTVGGWVSQGGFGVGAAKFGDITESVEKITIIGFGGKEFNLDDPKVFIGSCGTLGIVWKITLKIKPISSLLHFALASESQTSLLKSISEYQALTPYSLRYIDNQNLIWKELDSFNINEYKGGIILLSFHENDIDRVALESVARNYNLSKLSDEVAEHFWNDRYNTMKLKRQGPSLIVSEVLIPTLFLNYFIQKLSRRFSSKKYASEIYSTRDSFSVVFLWFPEDIRKWSVPIFGSIPFIFHWYRSFEVIRIALSIKGKPYSTGLWLSPYASIIHKGTLNKMKKLKKEIDPNNIFNKGKVFGFYFPRFFPIISWNLFIKAIIPVISVLYILIPKKFR